MSRDNLTVTWRISRPIPPETQAVWDSVIPRFTREVLRPEHVELVITDQYQRVAGQYAMQSPVRANSTETAEDYQALRADGAAAAAKTIELPEGKVVVVAASTIVNLGSERAERILLHEARHVRLAQDEDSAWGVHRRVNLNRPADVSYDFIWAAEAIVDEFRCERALHEAGVPSLDMGSDPANYTNIARSFGRIRNDYYQTGNLLAAYQAAFSVLQRLGQFLAYGAAHIAVDSTVSDAWRSTPAMATLLGTVSGIPSADRVIPDEELVKHCVNVARMLRQMFRDNGFDSSATPDNSLYFELLR